jgi:hypothetical protein
MMIQAQGISCAFASIDLFTMRLRPIIDKGLDITFQIWFNLLSGITAAY